MSKCRNDVSRARQLKKFHMTRRSATDSVAEPDEIFCLLFIGGTFTNKYRNPTRVFPPSPNPTGAPWGPHPHPPWGWGIDFEKPRGWGILTETPWGFGGGFTWFFVLFRRKNSHFCSFLRKNYHISLFFVKNSSNNPHFTS